MRVGILQPYLLPYIGYFQLMAHVDQIVLYDDAQYTKKGWINRNRFQANGVEQKFTVPLERASDFLEIRDRRIAPSYTPTSILNQLTNAYQKSPNFPVVIEQMERVFNFPNHNLFLFLLNSIKVINQYLEIQTPITISSEIFAARGLKGKERVVRICKELGADTYINPQNGKSLYDKTDFEAQGLQLLFLEANLTEYHQSRLPFLPGLSILDVMMWESESEVKSRILEDYVLFS